MDYLDNTKEEVIEMLEKAKADVTHLKAIEDAQLTLISALEENAKQDYQKISMFIEDCLSSYELKYNLANPQRTIKFKLGNEVGQCKPFQKGGATVVAKAVLRLTITYRSTLTGESETYDVLAPSFGFHRLEDIEKDGWEETLYKQLGRSLVASLHKVIDAQLKG